jgi:hypothetical protein
MPEAAKGGTESSGEPNGIKLTFDGGANEQT